MGQVTGAEHGPDDGGGIKGLALAGGSGGEETEGVGIEAMELAFMAKAGEDGLGAGEGVGRANVGELGKKAAEAGGAGDVGGLGVGGPGLLGLALAEEGEELVV